MTYQLPLYLDSAEGTRQIVQRDFDRRIPASERNHLGQFATPPKLAEAMARLAQDLLPALTSIRFLDPACGTGVFFSALLKVCGSEIIASARGVEIDHDLAAEVHRLWSSFGLEIFPSDFTQLHPPQGLEQPNLILCNPPYVRHHHLNPAMKQRLKQEARRLGFPLNGLAGLYCYFILLAHEWLAPGGGAVWIVPAEFLDVNYGSAVKQYLLNRVTTLRIHRFDPTDVQFSDALVTSTILVLRKSPPPPGHQILLTGGADLFAPKFSRLLDSRHLNPQEKWGPLFTSSPPSCRSSGRLMLGDLFWIKRGLATGANGFFILDEAEANRLVLPAQFLRPVLPSHRLIPTDVIEADKDGLPHALPRLVLLDCSLPRTVVRERFPALHTYLLEGERRLIHQRYLPRSRSPWYSQEQRPPAPIICTYMARKKQDGRIFRFIRNYSQATAVNVYLLLYPKPALTKAARKDPAVLDRIFAHLQAVPDLECLGRVYGGGLNKLEPKELGALELPEGLIAAIHTPTSLPSDMWYRDPR